MRFVILENNIVVNIALADGPLGENWIQNDTAGIGWSYDGKTFTAPVIPEAPKVPVVRTLSKLEYMNRFHEEELVAIYTAAKSVILVEIWLEKFKLASNVDLDDPATIAGLQIMEKVGLIGEGRAAEIIK